jgi:hypothetical protein
VGSSSTKRSLSESPARFALMSMEKKRPSVTVGSGRPLPSRVVDGIAELGSEDTDDSGIERVFDVVESIASAEGVLMKFAKLVLGLRQVIPVVCVSVTDLEPGDDSRLVPGVDDDCDTIELREEVNPWPSPLSEARVELWLGVGVP